MKPCFMNPSSPNTYCVWLRRITVLRFLTSQRTSPAQHVKRSQTKFNAKAIERRLTERQGFEPWVGFPTLVFKTSPFNRSGTSPKIYYVNFLEKSHPSKFLILMRWTLHILYQAIFEEASPSKSKILMRRALLKSHTLKIVLYLSLSFTEYFLKHRIIYPQSVFPHGLKKLWKCKFFHRQIK